MRFWIPLFGAKPLLSLFVTLAGHLESRSRDLPYILCVCGPSESALVCVALVCVCVCVCVCERERERERDAHLQHSPPVCMSLGCSSPGASTRARGGVWGETPTAGASSE